MNNAMIKQMIDSRFKIELTRIYLKFLVNSKYLVNN